MHRRAPKPNHPFVQDDPEDVFDAETGPDSPSSWDDTKITRPSSKKSRRNVEKRVVSVPIADMEGSKGRGEAYPPSDSWAWRKYGQKPIKGSPYPRGYYRCSSAKGCPARKQVERSHVDPTKLIITYACEHNHPLPASTKSHHHHIDPAVKIFKKEYEDAGSAASNADQPASLDLSHVDSPMLLGGCCEPNEFGWFDDVAAPTHDSVPLFNSQICAGGCLPDADVFLDRVFSMREEDESLFGDLGDLPDCSTVFRQSVVVPVQENRRCGFGGVPCCDSSG